MKKRSYNTLQLSIPCSPGPGTLGSIFYVCCLCPSVEFWLLFPSVQLYKVALFAWCELCLVLGESDVCFNKVCTSLFAKWDLPSPPPEQDSDKTCGSEGEVLVGFVNVFWGRDPQCWNWGSCDWEGCIHTRTRGRFWCKVVSMGTMPVPTSVFVFMLGVLGREMTCARYFVPGGVALWSLLLCTTL